MTKRNITIVGIVVILIALAIIGGRRLVGVSAGVNEPVALKVGGAVAGHAKVVSLVGNELTDEQVVRADASEMSRTAVGLGVNEASGVEGLRPVVYVGGVESAAVSRAYVSGVGRVRV